MHSSGRPVDPRAAVRVGALLAAVLAALLVTLVAGPCAASPAARATAPEPAGPTTWTVQPASADGPDGRVSFRHVLDPGASVTEHVTVTNFSAHEATFVVYAGDGTVDDAGDFDVPPGEGTREDGGAWVTLGQPDGAERLADGRLRLTLAASSAVTFPLTVTVPPDAPPGDHPAGVVAELVDDSTAVRLAARVGARLHLRVAGEVEARLVADDVRTRWEPSWNPLAPGTVHVRYVVRNTGDVRLGARGVVALAGPGGVGSARAVSEVREVLPGRSAVLTASLRAWPLVRASGPLDVAPSVVGSDVVDAPLTPTSTGITVWTLPWAQLALAGAAAGAVAAVRALRRRSALRVQARVDAALAAAGVPRTGSAADTVSSSSSSSSP